MLICASDSPLRTYVVCDYLRLCRAIRRRIIVSSGNQDNFGRDIKPLLTRWLCALTSITARYLFSLDAHVRRLTVLLHNRHVEWF
jgi:hypothetical protein